MKNLVLILAVLFSTQTLNAQKTFLEENMVNEVVFCVSDTLKVKYNEYKKSRRGETVTAITVLHGYGLTVTHKTGKWTCLERIIKDGEKIQYLEEYSDGRLTDLGDDYIQKKNTSKLPRYSEDSFVKEMVRKAEKRGERRFYKYHRMSILSLKQSVDFNLREFKFALESSEEYTSFYSADSRTLTGKLGDVKYYYNLSNSNSLEMFSRGIKDVELTRYTKQSYSTKKLMDDVSFMCTINSMTSGIGVHAKNSFWDINWGWKRNVRKKIEELTLLE